MTGMRLKFLAAAAAVVTYSTGAVAAGQPAFRPLIVKAIESQEGAASATFSKDEPWVKLMRQRIGTEGPVTVTTKVVKRWKEPGCARVSTNLNFHEARFDQATKAMVDQAFSVEVNTCTNGQPPIESVDLRMVADGMAPEPQAPQSRVLKPNFVVEKDGKVRAATEQEQPAKKSTATEQGQQAKKPAATEKGQPAQKAAGTTGITGK